MQFGPQTPFSDNLHATKYRGDGEGFRESQNRLASALSDGPDHFHAFRDICLDMAFMAAGRVQAAMGSTRNVTPYNCYVSGIIADSFVHGEGSIMQRAHEAATTMRMGGGIGYDFGTLRPRGAMIKKLQSKSSGPVAFMDIFDAVCRCTASSGHRRGAQMGVMPVWHPDIEEFVHAKQNTTRLTGFNISVAVTDEFMRAVRDGTSFDLQWGGEVYRTIDARTLWDTIMRSTWDWAEPGVLFIDRINEMNNLSYCEYIRATNPCFTGDTKVWTAEYGQVPFAELVGRDVDVLTQSEDGRLVYRRMTNIRRTKRDATLVEVRLHDGSSIRCTPEHKFFLRDGRQVQARDLSVGDSLQSVYRYNANQKGYKRLTNGLHSPLEHHVPFEDLMPDEHVHHENGVKADNRPSNLRRMLGSEHNAMHMRGEQNPLRRHPARNPMKLYPDCTRGDKNGRWRDDLDTGQMIQLREQGLSYGAIATACGCSKYTVQKRIKDANHRVLEIVWLQDREDVFCGTVDDPTHRFFVALGPDDGVLVRNCGEQPLPPDGACLLGSWNLVKYVMRIGDKYVFNWKKLQDDIPVVVRAMDNVIDRATYPLPAQEKEAKNKRRMGLGVTGAANAIEAVPGQPYGSPAFLEMLERILRLIANETYRASALLAKEKGAFPLFLREKYLQSKFLKMLDPDVVDLIRQYGIRNSHLLSIAPTGTISMAADNVSSSIEPVFAYTTERQYMGPDGMETVVVEDYGYRVFGVRGKKAEAVTVDEHLAVLALATRWVDSAVSKTCNVPPTTPWADFKNIYMRAWELGCKGITTFQVGGKRFGILKDADTPKEGAACQVDPSTGRRSCE